MLQAVNQKFLDYLAIISLKLAIKHEDIWKYLMESVSLQPK